MKLEAILIALVLAGCHAKSEKNSESIAPTADEDSGIKLGPVAAFEAVPSSAQIVSLSYNQAPHSITLVLKYSGCREAAHSLDFAGFCAMSYPMQCGASLVREKNFDGSCEKLIEQSVEYPLDAGFDTAHLTISNADKQSKSITVDKNGVLTPPK